MQALPRLKRATWALLVGLALVVAGYFLFVSAFVVSAVAFSGSTGSAHTRFFAGLTPVLATVGFATLMGWVVYFVNAVFSERGWWLKSIALATVVGGAVAVASPRFASLASFSLLAPLRDLHSFLVERGRRNEAAFEALLLAFVSGHPDVLSAAGENPRMSVYTTRIARGSKLGEYEVVVRGRREFFAIVRAEEADGNVKFRLACLMETSSSHRDHTQDTCGVTVRR